MAEYVCGVCGADRDLVRDCQNCRVRHEDATKSLKSTASLLGTKVSILEGRVRTLNRQQLELEGRAGAHLIIVVLLSGAMFVVALKAWGLV